MAESVQAWLWPALLVAVAGVVTIAAFFAARIKSGWRRFAVLTALVLLFPLLVTAQGLVTGCLPRSDGERCFGVGFGMVLALMYGVPVCGVLVAIGAAIARRRAERS